jgi:general secretion pathway protein B
MSYILDALKKAESERNLGAVPNVYANAPQAVHADGNASWGKILPWSVAAIALGVVLIVLAWLQPWRAQPVATAPIPVTVPQPVPTPVTSSEPTPAPVAPPVVASAPVKPTDEPPQVKPAPIAKPAVPAAEKKIADTAPAKVEKPIVKAEAKPDTKAEVKPEVKLEAKADGSDVGTARDLPQAIQSQLPPISVNGYLYDKDPADRSVLMNQKLLREGDTVAPDLVLEKLLPKGAVLNYKGYRYRITF